MSASNLKFEEEYSAKLPAMALLLAMGWHFIPPSKITAMRGGNQSELLLKPILMEQLQKRRFDFKGKSLSLSAAMIERLIATLENPDFSRGLIQANEQITNHLLYGITVTEFISGHKVNPTIPLIDWENPEMNDFSFTEEFPVERVGLTVTRRPDLVCFVNGIPLAVMEAKRPDSKTGRPTIHEGISQTLRNQKNDEIPKLFAYAQLLVAINGFETKYATVGTRAKFWAEWHEEQITEKEQARLKNKKLSAKQKEWLFSERKTADLVWFENYTEKKLVPAGQDETLIGLFSKRRFLRFIRSYTMFDEFKGKIIARHQQFFGIEALLERIKTKDEKGVRQGGVIWHTTGSGKSLTMVFFTHALKLDEELKNSRLLVITDRKDLETQLSNSFFQGGAVTGKVNIKNARVKTGAQLARQIGAGQDRILFSLIQKFNKAVELPECFNDSADLIVLVDEGHRSQGGGNHAKMRKALPNAAFIAFTGTPLLKKDKTASQFGRLIHSYTMQQAVAHKMVTPLLYEERPQDLEINQRPLDKGVERLTAKENEAFTEDVKKHFAKRSEIYRAKDRIRLIAQDIAEHLTTKIPADLKAMLCCDSKESAIRYQKVFEELDKFHSAVVISAPDSREGHADLSEEKCPEVQKWWKENVGNQEEAHYTESVKNRIANDPELRLLIVVDKLLTGFDEPKIGVLYIDKYLQQHNLLQAMARTNRLHESKLSGLLIDYRGILGELDQALKNYDEHAKKGDVAGYDPEDLKNLYHQLADEFDKLPGLHQAVWEIFIKVENKGQIEQLRAVLSPDLTGDTDRNAEKREAFFKALSEFANCLNLANQSAQYFDKVPLEERQKYSQTLRQMHALRHIVRQDCGLAIDFTPFEKEMRRLIHQNVSGVEVEETKGAYEVGIVPQDPAEQSPEMLENEARALRNHLSQKIAEMNDDPYAKEVFSALLQKVIDEAKALFDDPLKKYLKFKAFAEKLEKRDLKDIPDALQDKPKAKAYYGLFLKNFGEVFYKQTEKSRISLMLEIEKIVEKASLENSLNTLDREKAISKELLPLLSERLGSLDFAKIQHVIEEISQCP